jgi:hypothetical protein
LAFIILSIIRGNIAAAAAHLVGGERNWPQPMSGSMMRDGAALLPVVLARQS